MANAITFLRVILAGVALLLATQSPLLNFVAIILTMTAMLLDALDGILARYLKTSSVAGSIYDILADRIIENVYFIYFLFLSLYSVWICIIVVTRGLIIDAIRTIHCFEGRTAFGPKTLHIQNWCKFLSGSKLSRGSYNLIKMLTFMGFVALSSPESYLFQLGDIKNITKMTNICLFATIIMSFIRALPVLLEGLRDDQRFSNRKNKFINDVSA